MDTFSRVLINAKAKQVLDDAFRFLVILKYSKWLLENLNYDRSSIGKGKKPLQKKSSFRSVLSEGGDAQNHIEESPFTDASPSSSSTFNHQIQLLKFRFLITINQLHEFVMCKLDEEITLLVTTSQASKDFEALNKALHGKFLPHVSRCTFQEKGYKKLLGHVYETAAKIGKFWTFGSRSQQRPQEVLLNNNLDLRKEAAILQKSVHKLEAVVRGFSQPLTSTAAAS